MSHSTSTLKNWALRSYEVKTSFWAWTTLIMTQKYCFFFEFFPRWHHKDDIITWTWSRLEVDGHKFDFSREFIFGSNLSEIRVQLKYQFYRGTLKGAYPRYFPTKYVYFHIRVYHLVIGWHTLECKIWLLVRH